jgi:serine phosphatase RsbU (regulator of sigma subunit)
MWSEIIYNTNDQLTGKESADPEAYRKIFTDAVAEGLYNDSCRSGIISGLSDSPGDKFETLPGYEKSFWYNYSSGIPRKLRMLNLFIRPFEGFCRTCIITDKEIDTLVHHDLSGYCREFSGGDIRDKNKKRIRNRRNQLQEPLHSLITDWDHFCHELNLLIPVELKKIGYEVIRQEEAEEIDLSMIRRLARAIHSKYLSGIRNRIHRKDDDLNNSIFYIPADSENIYPADFDELPDEIKYSNIDNAAQIPAKLLSIGYKIREVKKGFKPVALHLNDDEIETMARVEHIRWSWEKRLAGWVSGDVRDDKKRTHPSLVPYDELSEPEKEKDRKLVSLIPALLLDINYEAFPVSPNRIRKLSYAIKPQGSIQKILDETRELNEHIRVMVALPPEIEEIVIARNKKIEEAIREVEGSYKYARHIQETFLPDDLYVRECFPESFILFKPKDLVSGDFYFFSRNDNLLIFAAADCTGHGIPGALLSTVGYGILDQAVNEIKLTDPKDILFHLYSRLHRFLRNDSEENGISDDMDIVLGSLDTGTNILTYSCVKNSLYHISNGKLTEHRAQNSAEVFNHDDECMFTSDRIRLKAGDTIYLCSDGYADQFGGRDHKKYRGDRFKVFLQSISGYPMPEQNDLLYEELEKWREENNEEQTDDILVIGIRL